MSPLHLSKIGRVLSADGELQPVLAKARDIRALGGLVERFFPPELARQIRVANLREGELVLAAANPAAASKIKLLAEPLGRYLATQRWQVNSVSARVQPRLARAAAHTGRTAKSVNLSTAGLDALRKLHGSMSPSPARNALAALLAHQGKVR